MTTNVTAILQRRDRLRELFRQFWNCTLDANDLQYLIPTLQKQLPRVGSDALFETLRQYVGRELPRSELDQLAWLLAANLGKLQVGEPLMEWAGQLLDEWVPVQVLRVFPERDRFNQRVYRLWFVVLSGTPAGKTFQATRKPNFLAALSRKIGFTKRSGKLPYLSGYQYMSLRLLVQIRADRSQQDLVFEGVKSVPGLNNWNTRILKQRHRITPCPERFTHQCHRCVVGTDRCLAATHRKTYTQRTCQCCGDFEAWFDPELDAEFCVECEKKRAWQAPGS